MKYIVKYEKKMTAMISSQSSTDWVVIDSLADLEKIKFNQIYAIYEIARSVPFETKHREEKTIEVVRKDPYLQIDGSLEIDIKKEPNPYALLSGILADS